MSAQQENTIKPSPNETNISLKFLSIIFLLNFILSIYHSWLNNYVAIHWVIFALLPMVTAIFGSLIFSMIPVIYNNLNEEDQIATLSIQSMFLVPNSIICVIITLINPNWIGLCAGLCGIIYYIFLFVRRASIYIPQDRSIWFGFYVIFCLAFIYVIHSYQYQQPQPINVENKDISSEELQAFMQQFEHDNCSPDIIQLINELKMENIALNNELQQLKSIYINKEIGNASVVTQPDLISTKKSNLTHTITLLNNYNNIYNSWDISTVQLHDIINEKSEMNADQFDDKWFQDFVTYKKLINQQQDFLDSSVKFGTDLFEQKNYLRSNISYITTTGKAKEIFKKKLAENNDQYDKIEKQKLKLSELIMKYDHLKQINAIQKTYYDFLENALKEYEDKLLEIEILIKKFYLAEQSNLLNIPKLEKYIENQWKIFERNWAKWGYNNILLWIKYKMNWFDDESCPTGINLNDIGNELYKQEINGKFLQKMDKDDLYQLGFVNFDIRKTIYQHIVELITKYKGNEIEINELQRDDNKEEKEKQNHDIKIPSKYICPLTNKIMIEPVVAFDINTYEKDAIIKYLKNYKKSPITNELFNHHENEEIMLFADLKLKREIEIFIKEYPDIYKTHISSKQHNYKITKI